MGERPRRAKYYTGGFQPVPAYWVRAEPLRDWEGRHTDSVEWWLFELADGVARLFGCAAVCCRRQGQAGCELHFVGEADDVPQAVEMFRRLEARVRHYGQKGRIRSPLSNESAFWLNGYVDGLLAHQPRDLDEEKIRHRLDKATRARQEYMKQYPTAEQIWDGCWHGGDFYELGRMEAAP